jgi:hypothetical protein
MQENRERGRRNFLILEPLLELEILWAMGSLWCEEEGRMSSFESLEKHYMQASTLASPRLGSCML